MTTPVQPEPSERSDAYAEAEGRLRDAAVPIRYDDTEAHDYVLLSEAIATLDAYADAIAARPAPVVSAEAAEAAARGMWESRQTDTPWAEAYPPLAEMYRDLAREAIAALGITVADTPAAEPGDDPTGWRSFARDYLAFQAGEPGSEDRMRARAGLPRPLTTREGRADDRIHPSW